MGHDLGDECECDSCLEARDYYADLERKEKIEKEIWQKPLEEDMQEAINAINRSRSSGTRNT